MSEQKMRIGLLSFAHFHQNRWISVFLNDPRVEVVGIWDDDEARLSSASEKYAVPAFHSESKLLSVCDAAAICSETQDHPRLLELCCKAGVAVLCEKPAAVNLEESLRMKKLIEASGILYYQSFPQRHIPSNKVMKKMLDEKALGRITHIRKRHGHYFGLQGLEKDMPWIVDPAAAGGGAFLDEGIHEADVLSWFFGEPESVCAEFAFLGDYPVETSGAALYRFPGEILCVLECGWNWQAGGPTTEIYGEKGVLIQNLTDCSSNAGGGLCPHLNYYDALKKKWKDLEVPWDFGTIHSYAPKDFINVILGQSEVPSGIDDGIRAILMIEGASLSHREKRTIRFPHFSTATSGDKD